MKEKLRITWNLKNSEWTAKTLIGGLWMVLTDDYYMFEDKTMAAPENKSKKILKVNITPQAQSWELLYDKYDKPLPPKPWKDEDMEKNVAIENANALNRRKRIAAREFFAKCNQLEHGMDFENGFEPSAGEFIGTVELVSQKGKINLINDVKKVQVFNQVMALSWQEQYDLALYYAPYLAGKRRSEILYGLIGLYGIGTDVAKSGGKMWQRNELGKITNAEDYLLYYKNNPTVVMKIYINKAIALGIIKQGSTGLLLNGNTFVGRDANDAVVHFSNDVASYTNIIQPEVNRVSALPEDDLVDEKLEVLPKDLFASRNASAVGTLAYQDDHKKLKGYLEDIGGHYPNNDCSYNDLKVLVEKQEKLNLENKRTANSPSGSLALAVDPLLSNDMAEIKEIAKNLKVPHYHVTHDIEKLKEKIREKQAQLQSV